MKQRINNLDRLLFEKQRLQQECKRKEVILNEHFHYLQKNAGSLLLKSVLPFKNEQTDKISGVLDIVNGALLNFSPAKGFDNEKTNKILKAVQLLVAGFVFKKVKDAFGKKKEDEVA